MAYLSQEFLSQYKDIQPKNAGMLFEIIYLLKYSRWLENEKRRETWAETIQRVVEYSCSLYSGPYQESLKKEAELMFDNLFHLKTYPAGRSLWIAGTKASELWPESNFNCTMLVVNRLEAFCDLFHLLMVGAGVGYRVLREDVAQLPEFITAFEISHLPYSYQTNRVVEKTEFKSHAGTDSCTILVGDSKEAWVQALRFFLVELIKKPIRGEKKQIFFNYNYVRPNGSRINTFGGRAAGPEGLMEMFNAVSDIIKECNGLITPVGAMDMCNAIAKNVLVGGVRRSAQIALGPHDDDAFVSSKVNPPPEKHYRNMSNNSVVLFEKPSKDYLVEILDRVKKSWEPGFLNFTAASNRRPWFAAVNPCGEAAGADMGNCNLSGTFLPSHINAEGTDFDYESLEQSHRLATRIGLRQTNITWSLPHWDVVHKRDRLLGVSVTGVMDAFDKLGWEFDDSRAVRILKALKHWANSEADKYAFEMRVPRPLLVTVVKPEGTISQLTTVSSGLHRSYAPYYIRRIKVSEVDPICPALQKLGVKNEPDTKKPGRIVFSFPIKTQAKIKANEESAQRQLERYLLFMKHYTDHNNSITISIGEEEWASFADQVYENWDSIVAIAMANKSIEDGPYDQLPYEAITEEEYLELPRPDLSSLVKLVNKLENRTELEEEPDDEAERRVECSGGFCPVK